MTFFEASPPPATTLANPPIEYVAPTAPVVTNYQVEYVADTSYQAGPRMATAPRKATVLAESQFKSQAAPIPITYAGNLSKQAWSPTIQQANPTRANTKVFVQPSTRAYVDGQESVGRGSV